MSIEAYCSVVFSLLVNEPENGESCDRQSDDAADPYRAKGVELFHIEPFRILAEGKEP